MLAEFEPMQGNLIGRELNATQIIKLLKAMVHPERRES
jgi:hypothetical protein